MSATIDIKTLLFLILGIALLVLIIYLIQLTRKCITAMNHTNKILEDASVVTELASKRSKDVDGIIDNVSESVGSISKAIKGEQNTFAAIASIVKSAAAVKNAFTKETQE